MVEYSDADIWPRLRQLSGPTSEALSRRALQPCQNRLASGLSNAIRTSDFDQIVEGALHNIPARFRSRMDNAAIVVEDEPAATQLNASGTAFGGTLVGLYEGRPLTHRSVFEPFHLPDRITLFQGPHERLARNREDLERLVEQTLWHEIAHHFGMNEREVRAAERLRRMRRLWPH